LVVITIIGTLVALLLPAVGASRRTARAAACTNNMRNLGQAMLAYETAKGQFPGYSQLVKRSQSQAVGVRHSSTGTHWEVINVDPKKALPVSWAAMLLPHIDRHDLWDLLRNVKADPGLAADEREGVLEIRSLEVFVCPDDSEATATSGIPALSYCVNAGAPDWIDNTFLAGAGKGDTTANGLFFNRYEMAWRGIKAPVVRLASAKDGSGTTILFAENCHKSYEPVSAGGPARFTWLFGTEQHLGIVWVVNNSPQLGNSFVDQEAINRVGDDAYIQDPVFDPNSPRFARPASNHGSGVNIVFCDGHTQFLADSIDYIVYQQLLTANGRKCVDPRDNMANLNAGEPIHTFRNAPPLSADDYQ
jgi:prepilin-type processing-associated H-X9-DG protein